MSSSTVVSPIPGIGGGASTVPPASARIVRSLKERAKLASMWTTAAYGSTQALRLINSIILARMLVPHEIGLMVMVSVFIQGLQMFSDIGTGPAIIHSKRGDQMEFLNTAWTMQVLRGFALWIAACAGAWPISIWFNEPALIWLIPIAGFGVVISGFNSTSLVYLNRQLYMGRITAIEIVEQVITMIATFGYAWYSPTVWALVVGNFVGVTFRMVASHLVLHDHRNWFAWNKDDAQAMYRFGRWIFLSTALTFFVMQTDKLLMGRLMGSSTLAIYGYAIVFATLSSQFIKKIGSQVGFPMLAEIARERPESFYSKLRLMRLVLVGIGLAILLPLIVAGDKLIQFLYPPEWHGAGWMLQVLAAGAVGGVVVSTYGAAIFALGKTFYSMLLMITQFIFMVTAALTGFYLYGEKGFIAGIAVVEWLNYPVLALVMARQRIWQPEIDLAALLVSGLAVAAAYYLL
jgi:O-antigen/teichoic acid export membrane protein